MFNLDTGKPEGLLLGLFNRLHSQIGAGFVSGGNGGAKIVICADRIDAAFTGKLHLVGMLIYNPYVPMSVARFRLPFVWAFQIGEAIPLVLPCINFRRKILFLSMFACLSGFLNCIVQAEANLPSAKNNVCTVFPGLLMEAYSFYARRIVFIKDSIRLYIRD